MAERRTFYRVVRRNPPRLDDFRSNAAKGRAPWNNHPETLRLWDGISVFDLEDVARSRARGVAGMGRFIAALRIPAGGAVRYEKTTTDPHHFTLWGEPAELQALVTAVTPVHEEGQGPSARSRER